MSTADTTQAEINEQHRALNGQLREEIVHLHKRIASLVEADQNLRTTLRWLANSYAARVPT